MKRGRRTLTAVVAAGAAIALVTTATAAPATAGTSTRGSSYAAAAQVGAASGITVQTKASGLLQFLGGPLSAVIEPLLSDLTSVIPSIVAQATSALGSAGWSASNTGTTVQAPAAGTYPDTCTTPWNSQDCFGANLTVGSDSLIGIGLGTVQGYAAYDSSGYTGAARLTDTGLSMFGISLMSIGTVESTAHCDSTGTCTQTQDVKNLTLLNNAVDVTLADGGQLWTVTSGGNTIGAAGLAIPLNVAGIGATVSVNGNLVTVKMSVSLDALTSVLNLGGLTGHNGAGVDITLTLGPGNVDTSGGTGAWGLDIGLDLAAHISLDLGLAGLSVAVPTGVDPGSGNYGNLLDLKLAYSRANAPQATGSTWYPPGLI